MNKTITQSRTNRTVAGMVAVVGVKLLVAHVPMLAPIAEVLTDEVAGVIITGLGALAVAFRQAANGPAPVDKQDVDTPR